MTQSITRPVDYRREIANIVSRQLHGDYSDALTRFSYLKMGADQFLRLVHSPEYTSYRMEQDLLARALPQIARILYSNSRKTQIVELGPGDGSDANLMLSYLNQQGFAISYLALDISENMLQIARNNQNIPNSRYIRCNFRGRNELRSIISDVNNDRLFLLLGNTLANEVNMESFLSSLRQVLNSTNSERNYLLVGIELLQEDINQVVREYRNEENYALTIRPLEMLGVERTDGIIDIDFNYEGQRIEEWFIFNRDREIRPCSEIIRFQNGDRILLSVTYKPTITQIREMVKNSGWNEELIELDESRSYALLLLSSNEQGRLN